MKRTLFDFAFKKTATHSKPSEESGEIESPKESAVSANEDVGELHDRDV